VGQRSATETLFAIVHAFIEKRTSTQPDLARHLELGVPALRRRLSELQAANWPVEREAEGTQVYGRLLETVMKRLSPRDLAAGFDASTVVTPEVSAHEDRFLPIIEDAAARRQVVKVNYTASRRDLAWRWQSPHRVDVGPPARFLATCYRSGEVKTFRADGVQEAHIEKQEASAGWRRRRSRGSCDRGRSRWSSWRRWCGWRGLRSRRRGQGRAEVQ